MSATSQTPSLSSATSLHTRKRRHLSTFLVTAILVIGIADGRIAGGAAIRRGQGDKESGIPSRNLLFEDLDNGNIEEAHPLILQGEQLEDCGSNFQQQEYTGSSAACDLRRRERDLAVSISRAYGLWYTYNAVTSGPVTVVLCGSDGYDLELFSENRHTVCSTMRNGDVGQCGGTSVSWIAQEGKPYYILAHDRVAQDYDSVVKETYTIEIVDNDKCQYAFGPVTPTSAGLVMSYNTTDLPAQIDAEVNGSTCGGASVGGGPGVWYKLSGTGLPLTASTCSDKTTFDTQVSVYGGTSCDSLTCINGNNDACGKASSVTWPSQDGKVYYVYVQGATMDEVGEFELTLTTEADRPENDFCLTAEALGAGDLPLSFSLTGSDADDVPVCSNDVGKNSDISPGQQEYLPYGIWYSFVGTGQNFGYEVSIPDETPLVIKVLTGGCGGLQCVDEAEVRGWGVVGYSNQGHCIPTTEGQTYYIFIATKNREHVDAGHMLSRLDQNEC